MNIHPARRRAPGRSLLLVAGLVLLISLACQALARPFQGAPTATPSSPPPASPLPPPTEAPGPAATAAASPPPLLTREEVYPPAFADYPAVSVRLPQASPEGYTLPLDLEAVQGLEGFDLSEAQRRLLAQNGFVVADPLPGKYNEFYQLYESLRYETEVPIFVTTDAVFHVYHLIFDKMLRDLEREHFIPDLEALTQAMLEASLQQFQAVQGTALEEPARRNVAYFAVAARLLGLPGPLPPPAQELAYAELALIEAQGGPSISPIWDRPDLPEDKKLIEDYSQFIPRGHYTRSEELKRYFRAMMWYGRMTFRLRDAFETRRALLLVHALRGAQAADGTPAATLWERIYDPTVFIVGKADDLSYHEYGAISDAVFASGADLLAFADDARLEQFVQAARQLPPPQVNSMWVWIWEDKQEATQGFRFMGQRFTLDAYVFGQMIWRNVGTMENPRGLPKGLDFFAALGSEEALSILDEMGETAYAHYPEQMEKVRKEVASLELDSWTQNLYWSWLYAFHPIVAPKGDPYPPFMQTQAWLRKDLNAALGSWTELKHDTILYAKQVMAEMGGGEPGEPPHGYVEPNPEAYARLLALARMTAEGLEARGLLGDATRGNLANLMDLLTFLQRISEMELAGQPIDEQDYWRIQYFGGELEGLTLNASDCEEGAEICGELSDQKAALIADVATGFGSALEEAVGQPTEIYVVLPDEPWRLAVGGVFTYYEFPVSVEERMTDEQWQELVEAGLAPPLPEWTRLFMAP